MQAPAQAKAPPTTPAGGVLPIPAAATQTNGTNANKTQTKNGNSRLKVHIRRLPPGITQAEVQNALGEEYNVGKGRTDWIAFKAGKVSKEMSKPSRPARLYLQVTKAEYLDALSEKVRTTTFIDARNTGSDPVLLGPPNLEFAPYQKVPAGKRRHDARQGTIDQDPEFMEFLESLISPATKPAADVAEDKEKVKVTVTPLIQHLRDKKAAKEAAKQKKDKEKSKQTGQKDAAEKKVETASATPAAKEVVPPAQQQKKGGRGARAEKATTKPAAKATNGKDANATEAKVQPIPRAIQAPPTAPVVKNAGPQAPAANKTTPATSTNPPAASNTTPQTPARRANDINPAAAAARMLQRDLGLRGGRGGTLGRRNGRPGQDNNQSAAATTTTPASNAAVAGSAVPNAPGATVQPGQSTTTKSPASPAIMKRAGDQATPAIVAPAAPKAIVQPPVAPRPIVHPPRNVPMPQSGHGFLKHANPSQGITEALLEEVLGTFGKTVKVEIDKRKGFAYVEYTEPLALQKAIAASPIKVAQGSVQVLERKDRAPVRPIVQPPQAPRQVVQPPQAPRVPPMAPVGRGNAVPTGPAAFRPGRGAMVGGGRGRIASQSVGVHTAGTSAAATQIQPVTTTAAGAPPATPAALTASAPSTPSTAAVPAAPSASSASASTNAAIPAAPIPQTPVPAQAVAPKIETVPTSDVAG